MFCLGMINLTLLWLYFIHSTLEFLIYQHLNSMIYTRIPPRSSILIQGESNYLVNLVDLEQREKSYENLVDENSKKKGT